MKINTAKSSIRLHTRDHRRTVLPALAEAVYHPEAAVEDPKLCSTRRKSEMSKLFPRDARFEKILVRSVLVNILAVWPPFGLF